MLLYFDLELCAEAGDWLKQGCFFFWDKEPLFVKLKPAQSLDV
jgi:hypothetical protein